MTDTMRAIVLDAPGPPDALTIRELPVPTPAAGWVLIEVKAFGLNRSELHTRQGLASGVTFPRVLGIEAAGVVAYCPGGEFPVGQQEWRVGVIGLVERRQIAFHNARQANARLICGQVRFRSSPRHRPPGATAR